VIERVWRAGGTFQEWSEHFDLGLWTDALAAEGLSLDEAVYRDRDEHEALAWDHISAGLHRDFLWTDWLDALAEAGVEDCRWTPCYDCGRAPGRASSTWWPQRCPRRRQPGHGPGPLERGCRSGPLRGARS